MKERESPAGMADGMSCSVKQILMVCSWTLGQADKKTGDGSGVGGRVWSRVIMREECVWWLAEGRDRS